MCFEVDNLYEVMDQFDSNRKIEGPYKLENGWETVFYEGPNQEVIEFLQVKPSFITQKRSCLQKRRDSFLTSK